MNKQYTRIHDNTDIVLSRLTGALSHISDMHIPSDIPGGDMPGDKVVVNDALINKAKTLFPHIIEEIRTCISNNAYGRVVISIFGGSGSGKSMISSILSYMFNSFSVGCYTLSGDNYPHRIPGDNDSERLRLYSEGGMEALSSYLGSPSELNFDEVNNILKSFKDGADTLHLKRMGRDKDSIRYDDVDMSDIQILILEWTHGNSKYLKYVDVPILLNSTPEETLEYRQLRARDSATDSPFTMMVLNLEQEQLKAQADKAKIIMTKSGEIIDYTTYRSIMED